MGRKGRVRWESWLLSPEVRGRAAREGEVRARGVPRRGSRGHRQSADFQQTLESVPPQAGPRNWTPADTPQDAPEGVPENCKFNTLEFFTL